MTDTATLTGAAEMTHEEDLPHAPAVVWRALTERDLLARWMMPNDFTLTLGAEATFRANPAPGWDGIVKAKVLEIESEKRLRLTWVSGGFDMQVSWTLTPVGGGTRLKIVQSGFKLPEQQRAYDGAKFGWTRFAGQLKTLLAEGV